MRANFENSGYKAMKVKEFDRSAGPRFDQPVRARAARAAASRPGFGAALLGAVCVVAVFGLLGLLFSFG
jgi:predicted lipid-binding transport protein (Tim44 family)